MSHDLSQSFIHTQNSTISPFEEISTWVNQDRQVVRASGHVSHVRLMPRRKTKAERLESSVCRSGSLSNMDIWKICEKHFDVFSPHPAIGRGVGHASDVFAVGLSLDPNGVPFKEHADIIGWHDNPNVPDEELKHYWMDQAQKMAPGFRYFRRPD